MLPDWPYIVSVIIRISSTAGNTLILIAMRSHRVTSYVDFNSLPPIIDNLDELEWKSETNVAKVGQIF